MSQKQTNRDMLLDLYDDVSAIKYTLQEMRHELSELRTIATQTSDIKRDVSFIKALVKPKDFCPKEETDGGGWTFSPW
tara:strand:+ start:86 stop:319 length:234 start_codon:yes stop_codon:yes gene_type:complete